MGTGTFPGVKQPRRVAEHPPPSKCRGHERVGVYPYSPSGPQWPVIGRNFTSEKEKCAQILVGNIFEELCRDGRVIIKGNLQEINKT